MNKIKKAWFYFICILCSLPAMAQTGSGQYISVQKAMEAFPRDTNGRFFIFPEVRERPLIWTDSLRPEWLENNYRVKPFVLHAHPGSFFVFQTGVWAIGKVLKNLQVRFSDFENGPQLIPSGQVTCFNAGGTDYQGKPFTKQINVPANQVHALWIGVNIPDGARGKYEGTVQVTAAGIIKKLKVQLDVEGRPLPDHGFDTGKRLSRLAWLNSTVGINDSITKGYLPVSRSGRTLGILGRSMKIAANGLPGKITSYFTASNQSISGHGEPVTDHPFDFIIEQEDGKRIRLAPGRIDFTSASPSFITWKVINTSAACDLTCEGRMEFDGFVGYHLTVKAKKVLRIKDIRMEVPVNKDKAVYMMGLNRPGGLRPPAWDWKWDTVKNQDDLWLGGVNGGLQIKWKASNYVLPLVNVYYTFGRLHLPPSWGNEGKGGVHVFEKDSDVIVDAYSGSRIMKEGAEQNYDFELLITPFKTIDKKVMFGARYYQSGKNETSDFIHEADSLGADIITVHQGNDLYPFINYPFSDRNVKVLKDFIDKAHQDHKKVKVYYTTRELTVNLPEFWPFVSLGGEIIYPGPGAKARTVTDPRGPDPWLLRYLRGRAYIPAWVSHFSKGRYAGLQDLSVITRPESRMYNFYVAGLNWMVRHLKIDGIYIDDCSMDRTTIRRARKLLDDNRADANIDMHSWNHFNTYGGWASCMNLYMSLFPYIDQLWIGEGRNYDTPPDYWLVEISGIPFGLPGQMLQGGGNPWRGMVYGMTNRAGWSGSPPDAIWKFWDRYDIKDKEMTGYWDPRNPVTVDNDSVKVTVYKGPEESILAIGNFSGSPQHCSVRIDYRRLGYDQSTCTLFMPRIERFQPERILGSLNQLVIPAGKGYLLVLKDKRRAKG